MKTFTVFTLYLISLIPITLVSQAPQKIDFQAIARDAEGIPIASQEIGVKISIVKDSIEGEVVYEQVDTLITDISGLFSLKIGDGNVITGNFSEIDWGNGSYYTQVGIKLEGGANYIDMGTMEMVSVPYALHARNTDSWSDLDSIAYSMKSIGIGTNSPETKLEVSGGETILEQENWITPTFENGWVNYSPNYNPAGYFKDSNGIIHLRGLVMEGTNSVIFALPDGYKPAYRELHLVGTSDNNQGITSGRIDISITGEVFMDEGSNAWISLDGITFRAE